MFILDFPNLGFATENDYFRPRNVIIYYKDFKSENTVASLLYTKATEDIFFSEMNQ